jgi:hypothetical protein
MIGPRIEPVTCPECGLRARVRARPSDSPESFVNDNISKCFHASGIAILDCPSLKPQLVRADRALRGAAVRFTVRTSTSGRSSHSPRSGLPVRDRAIRTRRNFICASMGRPMDRRTPGNCGHASDHGRWPSRSSRATHRPRARGDHQRPNRDNPRGSRQNSVH